MAVLGFGGVLPDVKIPALYGKINAIFVTVYCMVARSGAQG